MSSLKQMIKKLYAAVSPQYRKILALEQIVHRTEQNMIAFQARNQNMLWLLMSEKANHLSIEEIQKIFWINYPKATGDLKIIQDANLYLIRCLSDICSKLDITFWLHGGSLIGALRHQGFIPWDDDVDVGMLRKDLDILMEYLKVNKKYQISMAYHDDHTFSRAYQFKMRDESYCCFIDIFVFDYYSAQPEDFSKLFHTTRNEMICNFQNMADKPTPQYISYHFSKYNPSDCYKIARIIDNALEKVEYKTEGDYLYYSIENYPFPYPLMKAEDIFPCANVPFEDMELNIPANSLLYLKGYGDFWQIPKDMGRPAHFSYYEPYIDYLKGYIQDIKGEIIG